jgi:GTP-binding protein
LNVELAAYRQEVAEKLQILVANKMDEPRAKVNLSRFRKRVKVPVIPISAKTGEGVSKLLERVEKELRDE